MFPLLRPRKCVVYGASSCGGPSFSCLERAAVSSSLTKDEVSPPQLHREPVKELRTNKPFLTLNPVLRLHASPTFFPLKRIKETDKWK